MSFSSSRAFVDVSRMAHLVERDAWLDLFAAAPDHCARRLGLSSLQLGDMGLLAARSVPIVEFNRAMCFDIAAPPTTIGLAKASEWLHANAAPGWVLQVALDAQTGAVRDWLNRCGMTNSGPGWAKLERSSLLEVPVRASGVEVRVVDKDSAEAFGSVVQAGFGLPVAVAEWFAALVGRPGWRLYLAYDGETPVASGAAFTGHGVGWFGMDATLLDHRGRGAQTALIQRRLEDGRIAGLRGFTAETGQRPGREATSYNNYLRASFTPLFVRPNYRLGSS